MHDSPHLPEHTLRTHLKTMNRHSPESIALKGYIKQTKEQGKQQHKSYFPQKLTESLPKNVLSRYRMPFSNFIRSNKESFSKTEFIKETEKREAFFFHVLQMNQAPLNCDSVLMG